MPTSAFELFSVGIGPSSSHTVGPMRAAAIFASRLVDSGHLEQVERVCVQLFGSLGATGFGHGSPTAVVLGLEGEDPATTDTDAAMQRIDRLQHERSLHLAGRRAIPFNSEGDLVLHRRTSLPGHPNGMTFEAYDNTGALVRAETYYSVGGGFVVDEGGLGRDAALDEPTVPFPFSTGAELLTVCTREGLPISGVVLANEMARTPERNVGSGLLHLWSVMADCVERGLSGHGVLPGGLSVQRRAASLHRELASSLQDPLKTMEWLSVVAMAVNEENAAGGRVVTAPTNGAAGVIPAVLHHYVHRVPGGDNDGVVRFLLAATAVGSLIKANASISGADVGCQGEIGSACAMAAAGLCEALGGTPEQVENAAEIGIEHNLGLTCDPIGGLVQIPCIERNAMGAVKAVNAAQLAIRGNGHHVVSLDVAIKTLRDTGHDMSTKYKETAQGAWPSTLWSVSGAPRAERPVPPR